MRYTRDMTIGIDISQIVFTGTGVSRYIEQMTEAMIKFAPSNTYILFGATLRQQKKIQEPIVPVILSSSIPVTT